MARTKASRAKRGGVQVKKPGIKLLPRERKQFVPFESPVTIRSKKRGVKQEKKAEKALKKESKVEKTVKKTGKVLKGRVEKKVVKKEKAKKEPQVKKTGNERLTQRDNVVQYQTNPFIFGKTAPDYVSSSTLHRQAIRALKRGDMKEFKKVIAHENFIVDYLEIPFSYGVTETANDVACLSKNNALMTEFFKEREKLAKRESHGNPEPNLLSRKTTGRRNFYMLGRATRNVEMSRGGKEGNNALLNYQIPNDRDLEEHGLADKLARRDVDFATLDKLRAEPMTGISYSLQTSMYTAVRFGQRETASRIIELCGNWDVNALHKATLKGTKLPARILAVSVKKKAHENRNITPLHTAAINNDVTYLKTLRAVEPNINILDMDNWSTVHYAAVCNGTEPLKYLISLDTPLLVLNKKEETPLHCAARAGRAANVKIILDWIDRFEKAQKAVEKVPSDDENEDEGEEEEPRAKKAKVVKVSDKTAVNYKTRTGNTALHLAVKYGHLDVVETLLKHPKIDVEAVTTAGEKKMNALMMACASGREKSLDIVKVLVDKGNALIESKDKLRRSPLLHAAMNGQDHVVAYLLQRGADLNKPDSSGNAPSHYAAAYGFLSTLQLLSDVDPTCLNTFNDWQLTPLSVAYLKGHYGIVSWMLDGPHSDKVNINCKDNEGVTLISSLVTYFDPEHSQILFDQLKFLIVRGADCSLVDSTGNSPLHLFAQLQIPVADKVAKKDKLRMTVKQYEECVQMILKAGAQIEAVNDEKTSAFEIALMQGNLLLAGILFDKCKEKEALIDNWSKGSNVLFALCGLPFKVRTSQGLWATDDAPAKSQFQIGKMLKMILTGFPAKAKNFLWQKTDSIGTPITVLALNYCKLVETRVRSVESAHVCVDIEDEALSAIRMFIDFDSEAIMQTGEVVLPGQASLIHIAVNGGMHQKSGHENYMNPLLELLLNTAHKHGRLNQLLCVRDDLLKTPLQCAILNGDEFTTKLLLNFSAAHGCAEGVHNAILQEWICVTGQPLSVLKSVLHLLVEKEMVVAIGCLQLKEFDWEVTDIDKSLCLARRATRGNSAFHYACEKLNSNTIPVLKQLRVPKLDGRSGKTSLHVAVDAETTYSADAFIEPIEYVLSKVDVNAKDTRGRTALHYAFVKSDNITSTQCDPIAVVSLLLSVMSPEAITAPDKDGNTALHFAAMRDANICAVTLMNHGCEINPENKEGNTPLGLAVLKKWPQTALTLIQAHSNIHKKVFGPEPPKVDQSEWTWFSDVVVPAVRLETSVPELVVKNEWHSMVYVILDLLEKTPATVAELATAALVNGQHNFAQYLLKMLNSVRKTSKKTNDALNDTGLLKAFVQGINGELTPSATTVVNTLMEMKTNWLDEDNESEAMNQAAKKGLWNLIEILKENGPEKWAKLSTEGRAKLLAGFIDCWIQTGENDLVKKAIASLGGPVVYATHVMYPAPALAGHTVMRNPPDMEFCSPITRAIQAQCPRLIIYLIEQGCPADDDSLLQAVLTNNRAVVKAVCEAVIEKKPLVTEEKHKALKPRPGRPLHIVTPMRTPFGGARKRKAAWFGASNGFTQHVALPSLPATHQDDDSDSASETSEESEQEEEESNDEAMKPVKLGNLKLTLKTKGLKLDYSDAMKRNVLHYMVDPVGWENTELLKAIFQISPATCKKLLQQVDGNGETPIQLAARHRQRKMVKEMNAMRAGTVVDIKVLPRDVSSLQHLYNIDEDAQHFLEHHQTTEVEKAVAKPEDRTPYKRSEYHQTGELVRCAETGQLFKVLLNKTDLQYGSFGFHNFYRLELIKRKDCDLFILYTNWGRIGDSMGEMQHTPFNQLDKAVKEFKSVFRSKTGQDWCPLDKFEEVNGKYRLVKAAPRRPKLHKLPIDIHSHDSGDEIYNFIKDISDVNSLQKYAKSVKMCSFAMDCPLGQISKGDIATARDVLKELTLLCNDLARLRNSKVVSTDRILELMNEQRRLSSDFYSRIPLSGYEQSALPVLDDQRNIMQCETALDEMDQIECATRILCGATWRKKECESIRYIQYALECDFRHMSAKEPFAQHVLQYVRRTSQVSVVGMIDVTSKEAYEGYTKYLEEENQMYLWHGTKAENLISILKHGLKSVPSNALQCGQAYGKGVYFADAFVKSESYCMGSSTGLKYMLLCQVAPGKISSVSQLPDDEKKWKFDTRYVAGNQGPDEQFAVTFDGVRLPCGPLIQRQNTGYWGSEWSEYVLRENARTMPRFIVIYK